MKKLVNGIKNLIVYVLYNIKGVVNHWFSWFNDVWCTYASVQIHEIGHNLGLSHAGEGSSEYADQSGMMVRLSFFLFSTHH